MLISTFTLALIIFDLVQCQIVFPFFGNQQKQKRQNYDFYFPQPNQNFGFFQPPNYALQNNFNPQNQPNYNQHNHNHNPRPQNNNQWQQNQQNNFLPTTKRPPPFVQPGANSYVAPSIPFAVPGGTTSSKAPNRIDGRISQISKKI